MIQMRPAVVSRMTTPRRTSCQREDRGSNPPGRPGSFTCIFVEVRLIPKVRASFLALDAASMLAGEHGTARRSKVAGPAQIWLPPRRGRDTERGDEHDADRTIEHGTSHDVEARTARGSRR